jgi:hypothetical protein
MQCMSCGLDREPIIEGDQSGRFYYTCGNASCHVNLGPVRREHTVPPLPPAAVAGPPAPQQPIAALPGGSYVETIRVRLAFLDAELAKAEPMRQERDALRRMLRAAERPGGARKSKSNVVPIAKARES